MSKEKAESLSKRPGYEAIWLGDAIGLGKEKGLKLDGGKLRFDLVDDDAEAEMVAVLSFGAVKYDPGNWRHVEEAIDRYFSALRRHLREFRKGRDLDPETSLHHLAHAECCVHFMLGIVLAKRPDLVESFDARFRKALQKAHEIRALREKKRPKA